MKRMMIAGALVATLVAAVPAQANAAWLSKPRAKAKTTQTARSLYYRLDWATDWSVEPSYDCARRGALVVECDYWLYDDEADTTCADTVRVRLLPYTNTTLASFPYEAECY